MKTVTLSDKYQVVIPKEVRKGLNLKPGQKLEIRRTKSGVTVRPIPTIKEIAAKYEGVFGDDAIDFVRKSRDEWEDRQKELDALWSKK